MLVCQSLVQPPARRPELLRAGGAATAAATSQTCVPAAQTVEGTADEAGSATATTAAPRPHARNVRGHDTTHAHAPATAVPEPARRSTAARRPPALSPSSGTGRVTQGARGKGIMTPGPALTPHWSPLEWHGSLARTALFLQCVCVPTYYTQNGRLVALPQVKERKAGGQVQRLAGRLGNE